MRAENRPNQRGGSEQTSQAPTHAWKGDPSAEMYLWKARQPLPDHPLPDRRPVALLAGDLLDAVNCGSAPELLQQLSRILETDRAAYSATEEEREGLALLQGVAQHLRRDLQSMLLEIYHRLESSRACLGLVRHLAETTRTQAEGAAPANVAERRGNLLAWPETPTGTERKGQSLGGSAESAKEMPSECRTADDALDEGTHSA